MTTATETPQPDFDHFYTLTGLADLLDVSPQTLYDLRSQGRGPRGFRVGRQLRFRRAEVVAWLAEMEEQDRARHPGRG